MDDHLLTRGNPFGGHLRGKRNGNGQASDKRNGNGHSAPAPGLQGTPAQAPYWDVHILMSGLPLQACSVLLRQGENLVLIDTGFRTHDTLLREGLRHVGVEPEQIATVINTHLHLDHFGNNDMFPRARVFASRRDYEWAIPIYESVCSGETRHDVFRTFYPEVTDEELRRMEQARLLQLIRFVWEPAGLGDLSRYRWIEDQELDLEGVRLIDTPGHTPGHVSVQVQGSDGDYLILGDARAFFDDSAIGYDMPPHNQRLYQASRQKVNAFRGILIPGHDDPFSQGGDEAPAADCLQAPVADSQ